MAELEKFHKKEMATKDLELKEKLQAQEKEFQEKLRAALVSIPKMCRDFTQFPISSGIK